MMSVRLAVVAVVVMLNGRAFGAVATLESGRLARFHIIGGEQGRARSSSTGTKRSEPSPIRAVPTRLDAHGAGPPRPTWRSTIRSRRESRESVDLPGCSLKERRNSKGSCAGGGGGGWSPRAYFFASL